MRPPSALFSARVMHYAIRDRAVRFVQRGTLYVGGTLLGSVPCLAITHDGDAYQLVHCTKRWTPRAAFPYPTVAAAKADAERRYPGLSARWKRTGVTRRQATSWARRLWKALACSWCGRPPYEIQFMFEQKGTRLCDCCVDRLAVELQQQRDRKAADDRERDETLRDAIARVQQRQTADRA